MLVVAGTKYIPGTGHREPKRWRKYYMLSRWGNHICRITLFPPPCSMSGQPRIIAHDSPWCSFTRLICKIDNGNMDKAPKCYYLITLNYYYYYYYFSMLTE